MNKLLKIFTIALATLLIPAVANAAKVSPDAPVMSRIVKNGQLVVGTSGGQPPMTMLDKEGKPGGFDVDLMETKLIARETFRDQHRARSRREVFEPRIRRFVERALNGGVS